MGIVLSRKKRWAPKEEQNEVFNMTMSHLSQQRLPVMPFVDGFLCQSTRHYVSGA